MRIMLIDSGNTTEKEKVIHKPIAIEGSSATLTFFAFNLKHEVLFLLKIGNLILSLHLFFL